MTKNFTKLIMATACVLCFALNANAQQQKHFTFNAVAANVDGLPKTVAGIDVNKDGKESTGSTSIGEMFCQEPWHLISIAEDFNFHSELIAATEDEFTSAIHGGSVDITLDAILNGLRCETDGLGLLLAKNSYLEDGNTKETTFTQEDRVAWDADEGGTNTDTDHGFDNLITKGFRYFSVTLAAGFTIDVYVLHMDAGNRPEQNPNPDVDARKSQLQQLVAYIKKKEQEKIEGKKERRPILIMGDTNCRYTRDYLMDSLFTPIDGATDENGNDLGMTIKDPWIELVRGGNYPKLGDPALMTHTLGPRAGEVVDKIFYINIAGAPLQISANAYERVMIRTNYEDYTDHDPVIVNFTITNTTIANDESDDTLADRWTVEAQPLTDTEVQGCEVKEGTFYLRNVGSKKYLKPGADWNSRATEGSAGIPITLKLIDGKYQIKTFGTRSMTAEAAPYLDDSNDNNGWTFEKVEGSNFQYYLTCNSGALYSTKESGNVLNCTTLNKSNNRFKWVLLDDAKMKAEMKRATTEFDCTPLLKAADFDVMDFPNEKNDYTNSMSKWTGYDGYELHGPDINAANRDAKTNEVTYVSCAVYNGTDAKTISQNLASMPAGKYKISWQGFYRCRYNDNWLWVNVEDHTFDAKVTFGDDSGAIEQNKDIDIGSSDMHKKFAINSNFYSEFTATLDSDKDVSFSVIKPEVGGRNNKSSWICIDNIKIIYQGEIGSNIDPTLEYENIVANKINETWAKVAVLGQAGKNAYDISLVIWRLNNGYVTDEETADILCDLIDEAYRIALIVSQRKKVEDLYDEADNKKPVDVTGLIQNNSFEMGDLTHWTLSKADGDTKVVENSNGTYTTDGADSTYIFNTFTGDKASTASSIKQTIVDLKNGLYELTAKVTSHNGHTVFLVGNNSYAGVVAEDVDGKEAKTVFKDASLYFLVEDGTATIGAVGGTSWIDGADGDFSYYMPNSGSFFKADNFKLNYICDLPHGRLKLAIDDAKKVAEKLDKYGNQEYDGVTYWEGKYDKKTLENDGTGAVAEINGDITTAVKAQKTKTADFTRAIINPSFENGSMKGWTQVAGIQKDTTYFDTNAKKQTNVEYAALGVDGGYLFNTWTKNLSYSKVAPITQTVTGLPKGKYSLSALMSSDAENKLYIQVRNAAGTVVTSNAVSSTDKTRTATATIPEIEVTDAAGTLTIYAGGGNPDNNGAFDITTGGCWYKVDDFRLTYLGRKVELDESTKGNIVDITDINGQEYTDVTINRPIPGGNWTTLAIPYAAAIPEGLTVYKFTGDSFDAATNTINFQLTEVTGNFEPHVPYMVKHGDETNSVNLADLEVKDGDGNYDVVKLDMNDQATALTYTTIHSTYSGGYIPNGAYYIANNKYYRIPENYSKQIWATPYRIYITLNSNVPAGAAIRYSMDGMDDGTTGIEDIENAEVTVVAVYSADGRLLESPQRGVNILKMSDGTTQKVFVK